MQKALPSCKKLFCSEGRQTQFFHELHVLAGGFRVSKSIPTTRRSAIGRLWEPFLWATGRWRSVFGCQKVFLPLAKSITTTRTCLTQAGAGCWEYFFNVKYIQKSLPKAWGSMGEARGKRGGSVGEAGGSRGIFRGSALFDPRKRSVLGGSNRPQYPF